jgi:hypothetical protein
MFGLWKSRQTARQALVTDNQHEIDGLTRERLVLQGTAARAGPLTPRRVTAPLLARSGNVPGRKGRTGERE